MEALSFAVLVVIIFLQSTDAACPTHCKAGQTCNSADSGCAECEQGYYGRQCQHRMQCRYTVKGSEYRGSKNKTKSGITCQRWALDDPHDHNRNTEEENYCRMPDGSPDPEPWCYTVDPTVRYESCEIPMCDTQCLAPKLDVPFIDITNPPDDGFVVGYTADIAVVCGSGYEPQDGLTAATTTCQNDTTWSSTTLPSCRKIQCSVSLLPNNSKIINETDKYEYEDIIIIGCNTGYTLEGNNTLVCLANTSWSHPSTTCKKIQCQLPTLPDNSTLRNTKEKYEYLDNITFACNYGYRLKGDNEMTCQSDKNWSTLSGSCKKIKCQSPTLPDNSTLENAKDKYEYLDNITFVCNHGYRLQGNNEMTCQSNNRWSTPSGSCKSLCPSNCSPGQICVSEDNGCSDCDKAYYGRQCQHRMQCRYTDKGVEYRGTKNETKSGKTCQRWALDTPHEHKRHDNEENYCRNFNKSSKHKPWCFTSDAKKRWELCDIPKCDSQCPAPNLDAPNVDITNPPADGFNVGFIAVIDVRCNTGYQTNGEVSTACQSNKTWSSTSLPICIKIQCSKSLLPNNSKIIKEMDKYEYEDIITIGCNTGYTLEGNNTLVCLADKSWSHPSTTCNKIQCQLPTLPDNSTLGNTKEKYEYLDNITFVCNHGYKLQGNNEMTCQSNKTWSTPSGSCESLCPSNCKPGQICVSEDNGCSDCDQAYYGRQCQHRVQCRYTDKGVEYRGTKNETNSGITCQRWASDTPHDHKRNNNEENYCRNFETSNDPEPWCYTTDPDERWELCDIAKCDSQCPPPNLDASNVDITNPPTDGFSVGFFAVIDVRCDTGYQTNGQVSTTCQSNKTWSSTTLPICIKIQCSRSLLPHNSKIINEMDKYEYEDIITIGCNTGYTLEGNNTLVCLANTSWSHPSTTCKKIQCSKALLPNNSKIINEMDKYEYEDLITIGCNTGYTLEGNNTLVCLANTSWSHPSTTCKINQCSVPHLNARSNITQPKSVYAYSEVVTIFCESGHVLQGSYQLTCLANRTWNFELPTCTRIKCIELELSTHLSISQPIASEFKYGDIVSFKCKEGYKLNHSESLQCQANSRWSKVVPSCRQITETDNVGAIVGGTFGVLGVAVVVIVILFLLRRKRKSFKKQDDFVHVHLNDLENLGNIERGLYVRSTAKVIYGREKLRKKEKPEESGHNVYENIGAANANVEKEEAGPSTADNTYCNIQDAQNIGKIINIENLKNYIRVKKDDLHFFEEEFKTFPIGLQRPAQAAMRPKNRPKNKYKNIYPYDDNRIKLTLQQGVADSDFINASKIKGFNGKTKYIAAQGPQDATHVDFWRMIYEQRIRNIVMLTNVFEGGIKKCIQYWPDEEIYEAGAITVELQSSDKFADYTIRRLKLIKDDDITFVCQYHFTTWPDKGVPKCPCVLAQFHKKVFDILGQDDIPIVIHCSAGIGRTGTFIALDYLLDEAGKTGSVGISKALETLREQRVNMVQTKEQYAFLHDALVDALELRTSVVKVVEFSDKYKRRLVRNKTTGKFLLQEEFESINESTSYLKADAYTVGKREENKPKNRFNNILPTDVNRVHLCGQTADESYINAVYLPGYRNGYAYIITQAPLSNTIEDFWKLIFDEKIASIVALNQNTNVDEVYWPDDEREPREYGDFNISLICKDDEIGFQCLTYQICHKKEKHVVKQFKINFWPDTDTTPSTTAPMLKLIDNVQMQQNGTTPILVHCMNGADKSGLFCTAMALLGKLKGDEEISVQSLVKQMKSIRPQIVPNVEQYQYCYDLLGMYISSFETYSNFS